MPGPMCKHGNLAPGPVSVTLARDQLTPVFKGVPARVCDHCGEPLLDEQVSAQPLAQASAADASGVQVEVRRYAAS